jgi:hypothetical protein
MAIWARIKSLDLRQFMLLSRAFITNPRYIIPTFKATKKTVEICDISFGKKHHEDNPTNAFRHALWNFIICEKCYRVSGSLEKTIFWTKKITDLHENLFPNNPLAKEMDLHNNFVGRELFKAHLGKEPDPVEILNKLMLKAEKVKSIEEIKMSKNNLVYVKS